jgi:hypothetical protein
LTFLISMTEEVPETSRAAVAAMRMLPERA